MADNDYLTHLRAIKVKPKRAPKSAAEILGESLFRKSLKKKSRLDRVAEAWFSICDSLMSEHTEITSFRAGEVRVGVTSQALASELSTHRHSELLAKLNDALDGKDRATRLIFKAAGRR